MQEVTQKTASALQGRVLSNKMNKTVTVLIERKFKHAEYGKFIVRSTKVHAHDELNECNVGDVVQIAQTRPLSKTKTWRVIGKISKSLGC